MLQGRGKLPQGDLLQGSRAPATRGQSGAALSLLGVPVQIEAECDGDAEIVRNVYRAWQDGLDSAAPSLKLRIERSQGAVGAGPTHIVADGNSLQMHGGAARGWANSVAREAHCIIAADRLENSEALREAVDPLLLFLLTRNGRIPIHAAAFLSCGTAVLLAGPSGSGKSCLALAARSAGLPIMSDDSVYVGDGPALRLWGVPAAVHVFPQDAPAGSVSPLRLRNGKLKRAIAVPETRRPVTARRAVTCLLVPGSRAFLRKLPATEACAMLDRPEPGFDLLWPQVRDAHARLCANGAWMLGLSADPAEAIRLLQENASRLERCAVP